MITCAKGLTSGYSPLGAMIASDRLFEPFYDSDTMFPHGYTFGGHPVSTAVALANLDIFEREGLNDRVRQQSPALRATLEKLYDLPIVGDVRGEGYFFGIELVKDKATRQTFTDEERRALLGRVSSGLFEAGLYCRTDDRGDSVIQLAPPLISGQAEFDTIESIVRGVLSRDQASAALGQLVARKPRSRPGPVAAAAGRPVAGHADTERYRRPAPRERARGCRRRRGRPIVDGPGGRAHRANSNRRRPAHGHRRHRRATRSVCTSLATAGS